MEPVKDPNPGVTAEISSQLASADEVPFEGRTIKLGGRVYVIPSLTMKQAKQLWEDIKSLNKGITEDTLLQKYDTALKIIHAAMVRNYPKLTVAELEDLIDLNNLKQVIAIVSGVSGIANPGGGPGAAA